MTHTDRHDIETLRDLARQYAEIAAQPIQEERRELWSDHHSLRPTRPLVLTTYGMWNVWCREVFGDRAMQCRDPFYREYERRLRMEIFHDTIGDDWIAEPWITLQAARPPRPSVWGVAIQHEDAPVEGGAWRFAPVIKDWADTAKLSWPPHEIDEETTRRDLQRLGDAIGDLLPINVSRAPICQGFLGDIAMLLAQMRGLEQLMLDMYEAPAELHKLLAWMRDGILANQAAAEKAGHITPADGVNQSMTYCRELPCPSANGAATSRKQVWAFCAAQEFTSISPEMHDEFMLRYQKPIIESWGLAHYGCCEDLTRKIDMLRQIENLRSIAVAPRADVRRCAEQIGRDYVISWRPNPTDMVCADFDEARISRIIGEGLAACRGTSFHIHLKDIETVQGEPARLTRWVRLVRRLTGSFAGETAA
jgi:hypothetical protein